MNRGAAIAFGLSLVLSVGTAPALAASNSGQAPRCNLQSIGNKIKQVIHIQFDNVHLRRDNPNVPSDLEQMSNLLNFMQNDGTVFTDHHTPLISHTAVDMLRLVGLTDDYAHDGRVLFEALSSEAAGGSLQAHPDMLSALAAAYKSISAPLGELGFRSLTGISTSALKADDATYATLEAQIKSVTATRNNIAGPMITMLEGAAFGNHPIDEAAAASLIKQAKDLIASLP
jgi:hypothetical protein